MMGAHQTEARSRGWLLILLRWLAAFVVLGILFHFLPFALLWHAVERLTLWQFAAILGGYLLAHCLGVAKWRLVVNAAGAELGYRTSARCYAGGLSGSLFLPSIIGGDVVRLAVGLRASPNPAAVLAGNFADRFLDMGAQGSLVVLGLLLLPGAVPAGLRAEARKGVSVALVLGIALLVFVLLFYRPLLSGRSVRFRRKLARLRYALRAVSRRPHVLALGWLAGVAIQLTLLLLTSRIALLCGLVLPLRLWLFAWPLAKLAALLPLTQGGIGVREAALVGLLSPFGAPAHLVLATGLLWEGVIIAGGLLAGLGAFLLGRGEPVRTVSES